jgi:uncharacterized protein YecE (DUF72 family)
VIEADVIFRHKVWSKKRLYIGTSGWVYSHWNGIFYPKNLTSKSKLEYFSQHFNTAEINYSFYHLPKPKIYENWYNQTPEDFIFAVKASRFITHVKRLKKIEFSWERFLENTLHLKEKLGPILFQFPENFKSTDENFKRLEQFLELIISTNLRFAFEFRHKTWCDERVYKILKKYISAWVIADSPKYPMAEVITSNFVYVRMHGSKILSDSKYTDEELKTLAQKVRKWLKNGLDVYTYFNNDFRGYAIENAKRLLQLLPDSQITTTESSSP